MIKGIWLLLILFPILLFSQDHNMINMPIIHGKPQGLKIEDYLTISDSVARKNPQKATIYINMAIHLAQNSGDIGTQALCLNRLCALQLKSGHVTEALSANQKALMIFHLRPELAGHIEALEDQAHIYDRMVKSLQYSNLKIYKRDSNIFGILLILITFMFVYLYLMKSVTTRKLIKAYMEIHVINEELTNANHILDLVARKDPLTNLSNRRDMAEKLEYAQITYERNHIQFSIMMLDIDFFKQINDSDGHDAGDFVLVYLSQLMEKTLRKQDIVSRWGGDEFLILLPETDMESAKIVYKKILDKIEIMPCIYRTKQISIRLSAGVSSYSENSDIDYCIQKADQALYMSKNNGRNQISIATGI